MIVEYIDEIEDNTSCEIQEVNENNIMHVVYSLSLIDITKPQYEKQWNFYCNKKDREFVLNLFIDKNQTASVLGGKPISEEQYKNLKSFMYPSLGLVNLITIPTFNSIDEMDSHYREEHLKHVENIKRLDPNAKYNEELGIFEL